MHSPKLDQLSTLNCEMKPNKEAKVHNIIRIALLLWAFPRLAVSLLWTGTVTLATIGHIVSPHVQAPPSRAFFGAFAILVQLVELAMLSTFIVAGFKKSVKFYLIYYRYCILTLVTYTISVTICLSLEYDVGHYFGDLYISYCYFSAAGVKGNEYDLLFIASIIDFGFEILLIFLIKKLIDYYGKSVNNYTPSEAV
ncbi:hypothetical protein PYW07_012084 [Mythimna separata]|uniref:Uncharacterized protein n=1 Tax=Mythimna separata TaxID=271217 RepID=A0AAD7YKZ9_MYTSE|nr:hypothetical protein PYW07_012084 [Mythimna separata]